MLRFRMEKAEALTVVMTPELSVGATLLLKATDIPNGNSSAAADKLHKQTLLLILKSTAVRKYVNNVIIDINFNLNLTFWWSTMQTIEDNFNFWIILGNF